MAGGRGLTKGRALAAAEVPAPAVLNIRQVKSVLAGITKAMRPAAASGLTAVAYSTSAVQLVWSDNSATELGFRVEYSADGIHWMLAGYVGADQTGCRVTGLQKGRRYSFRLSAYNLAGTSVASGAAKVMMPTRTPVGDATKPSQEADQDRTLNVLHVKAAMPGLPGDVRVA